MAKKRSFRLTLLQKRAAIGYLFVLPFILGFIFLFLYPLLTSLKFSFSELVLQPQQGYELVDVGWENYRQAFFVDTNFNRNLTESIRSMVLSVPSILFFSFFAANILNQKFLGRSAARAVFFVPVIISSGVIAEFLYSNLLNIMIGTGGFDVETSVLASFDFKAYLLRMQLPENFVAFIASAVDGIGTIVNSSGVQILIFLAGLQSISPSLFEASNIEGATGWENFWLITFPMISPLILPNVVYTIIDSFTRPGNTLMNLIDRTSFHFHNYGLASAMAWIYFIIVFVIILITIGVISKKVFYQND